MFSCSSLTLFDFFNDCNYFTVIFVWLIEMFSWTAPRCHRGRAEEVTTVCLKQIDDGMTNVVYGELMARKKHHLSLGLCNMDGWMALTPASMIVSPVIEEIRILFYGKIKIKNYQTVSHGMKWFICTWCNIILKSRTNFKMITSSAKKNYIIFVVTVLIELSL